MIINSPGLVAPRTMDDRPESGQYLLPVRVIGPQCSTPK